MLYAQNGAVRYPGGGYFVCYYGSLSDPLRTRQNGHTLVPEGETGLTVYCLADFPFLISAAVSHICPAYSDDLIENELSQPTMI